MGTVTERKSFFEVFPGFECPPSYRELFEQVYVTKAVLVKSEKTLKLHIDSKILIPKQDIYGMEDLLSEFVFQGNMRVKFYEHYDLSNQYDVKNLTDAYKESMLFELSVESSVLYRLVKNAEWFTEQSVITLTLDDTFLAKTRSNDIKKYLEQVYKDRFDFDIQVGFDFTEEQKDAIRRANEHKLQQEVHQIMEQVRKNEEEQAIAEGHASSEEKKEKAEKAGGTSEKKSAGNGGFEKKTPK
ncbi:MAG: hypothetical protein EGQ63_00380, partial [Clostridiales bacterium]|nr:hypothetical protein [Clostridiales bacterium]